MPRCHLTAQISSFAIEANISIQFLKTIRLTGECGSVCYCPSKHILKPSPQTRSNMFGANQLTSVDLLRVRKHIGFCLDPSLRATVLASICFKTKKWLMALPLFSFQLALILDATVARKHQVESVPHRVFSPCFFTPTVR